MVLTVWVVLAGLSHIGTEGQAQGAIYIDFGDFPGEATKEPHVGWINVLAVSQGVDRPASGSGAQLEWADSTVQDLVVTKEADKSTPKLAESILTGMVHDKVVIDFATSTAGTGPETTHFQIELEKVRLTSYSFSDAGGGAPASETLSLNFEEIKWVYTEFKDGVELGHLEFAWDVIAGQPAFGANLGVPEPGTLTLAVLALLGFVAGGRRRRNT